MQQQRAKHKRDKTGELERYAVQAIDESFPLLSKLTIIYAWRDPPRYEQHRHGYLLGECRKLPNRDRDILGIDVIVIMARKLWLELSEKAKYRLMWHELYHIEVQVDDTMHPEVDQDGRIRINIRRHDLELPRFQKELEKFGPDAEERVWLRRVNRIYKKTRNHGQGQEKIRSIRRKTKRTSVGA